MKKFRNLFPLIVTLIILLSVSSTAAAVQAPSITQLLPPEPLTPVDDEYVGSRMPTFTFSQVPGIYKYRVRVTDLDKSEVVYTYKNIAACPGDGTCWLLPPYTLRPIVLYTNKGYYTWEVAAKLGDGWGSYSAPAHFGVTSGKFESSFNLDYNKWMPVIGNWTIASPGVLKNKGAQYTYTSIVQKFLFTSDTVYQARIKLKSIHIDHFGGIIVGGQPNPNGNNIYLWRNGLYIMIANHEAGVFSMTDGTLGTIVDWTYCSDIIPDNWNILKVVVYDNQSTMDVYINGNLWKTVVPAGGVKDGYMGLFNYQLAEDYETVLVDWANAAPFDTDY